MTDNRKWRCAGCGTEADGNVKPCDCITIVGWRGDPGMIEYTVFDYPNRPRPLGSNADEWRLFLDEHQDNLDYVAVQIAEAIDAAARE